MAVPKVKGGVNFEAQSKANSEAPAKVGRGELWMHNMYAWKRWKRSFQRLAFGKFKFRYTTLLFLVHTGVLALSPLGVLKIAVLAALGS